jgi:hypothetical protein|tara:strand:+ start:480 stop:689 length:210 start_codon:yes stop_codon:yes gene_type:complete
MKKLLQQAQNECANWDCGKCLGCNIVVNKKYLKKNKWAPVLQGLNPEMIGEDCTVEEGCSYFDEIVNLK